MQRQRGELVPIGEVVGGLDGPVKAIRDDSPQALHHFTQADQVDQLVGASEAHADLGFMARMMVLCSLPRTNPPATGTSTSASTDPTSSSCRSPETTSSPSATCRAYYWPGCAPKPCGPKSVSSF